MKYSFVATPAQHHKRLDHVLAERLPPLTGEALSKGQAKRLVESGAVYLNGKRVRIASKDILQNARIEVHWTSGASDKKPQAPFELDEARILFEDEMLIALNKPAGLATHATVDDARDNLLSALKRYLSARDASPSPYVGLHHRLDVDTSGVILFTKDKRANAGVADLFKTHEIQKTYLALVQCPPQWPRLESRQWKIDNYLRVGKSGNKKKMYASHSGGDRAITDFEKLESWSLGRQPGSGRIVLVAALPRTGRMHQIRVHLSEDGAPILGDRLYGQDTPQELLSPVSGEPIVPRLLLHASRLEFTHPISRHPIAVESPLPEDFHRCLDFLRKANF